MLSVIDKLFCMSIFLFLTSCSWENIGMGGGKEYEFSCTRQQLYSCLQSYANQEEHKIPSQWSKYDLANRPGYDQLLGVSVYYSKTTKDLEQIQFISLVNTSDTTVTVPSYVAIRNVMYVGDNIEWPEWEELSKDKKDQFEKKFKEDFIERFVKDSCSCELIDVI